ncbi:MAG TPA: formate dehydrogenase accessory sulfurtransferase FdhD, partial [Actinomycetota bacterium]|nr:formate dehydrogenase accessory sulfurtransferase FdhD [Actinomycetota bacterium]
MRSKTKAPVWVIEGEKSARRSDYLATEEPLEIQLCAGPERRTVAVTMRTPGADFELAAGFLYGEGVIGAKDEIHKITYCLGPGAASEQQYNVLNVDLVSREAIALESLDRHFFTSSACGVCGKASLEALRLRGLSPVSAGPVFDPEVINGLPDKLRQAQGLFQATGGLHAAALFDGRGELLAVREDVGRHNAVDKLIGWALLEGMLPLEGHAVMVSGRSSFEIVQKCVAAGVQVVCSVSAPSSLALEMARDFGVTLIGFLRPPRFNVYTGMER